MHPDRILGVYWPKKINRLPAPGNHSRRRSPGTLGKNSLSLQQLTSSIAYLIHPEYESESKKLLLGPRRCHRRVDQRP